MFFDPSERTVSRGDRTIALTPKATEILAYLIENREKWVSREALQSKFWEGPRVEINSVQRQISDIRRALGGDRYDFIASKSKLGYRFVAAVQEVAPTGRVPVGQNTPSTAVVHSRTRKWLISISASLAVALTAAIALFTAFRPVAVLLNARELTNDGLSKTGPLVSAGNAVFFTERTDEGIYRVASVSLLGGDVVPLALPFKSVLVRDISPDSKHLLVQSDLPDRLALWVCALSGGPPEFFRAGGWQAAVYSPNGKRLFAAGDGSAFVFGQRGESQRLSLSLPGQIDAPAWTPDSRYVRATVGDARRESPSLWNIPVDGRSLQKLTQLRSNLKATEQGAWTSGGKYFIFSAVKANRRDLYVQRELVGAFHRLGQPYRLTNGYGTWTWPTVQRGGNTVLALNQHVRTELVELDGISHQWRSIWGRIPALYLDFSRVGARVVYTHFPEDSLWIADADGSNRVKLGFGGLAAKEARWSPDGKRIAFLGIKPDGKWRIFIVSSTGGSPQELLPDAGDQGVPSWSSDGKSILFGEPLYRKPVSEMSLYTIDLQTHLTHELPNSKGLWSPRWSPGGKWIFALTSDSKVLKIRAANSLEWREIAHMQHIDHASWSPDSRYIYFDASIDNRPTRCLFRVSTSTARMEMLQDLKDFEWPTETWIGLSPREKVLAFRAVTSQELYALKCDFP